MAMDTSASKGRGRNRENNRIYAYPLPILFSPPAPPPSSSWITRVGLSALGYTQVENPQCEGVFDESTQSVWVVGEKDAMILWRRGFFGKGSLSRSEPSWLQRRVHEAEQRAKNALTAEEVRAKRRAERQQFKLARAQAFAASVAQAEAAFDKGDTTVKVAPLTREEVAAFIAAQKAKGVDVTGMDLHEDEEGEGVGDAGGVVEDPTEEAALEEVIPEHLEHLQLTLPEAFFLAWSLDCMRVVDSSQTNALSLSDIWTAFQRAHLTIPSSPSDTPPSRFDNPFLVHYALYHHYRSLGWVVRGGIKFCVDYLLYRRGPVFHHAEFAVTLCPVYEDDEDRLTSPFDLANSTPFSWSWLSTINRVNTQVQKTLILCYVTIPSSKRVPISTPRSPECLKYYSVREVVLRRFVPARMRD